MSRKLVMKLRIDANDDAEFYFPIDEAPAENSLSDRVNDAYDGYYEENKERKELNPSYFYCYNMNELFFGENKRHPRLDVFHAAIYTDGYVYFRCKQCSIGSRLGRLNSKIRKAIYQYFSDKKEAEKWKYLRVRD